MIIFNATAQLVALAAIVIIQTAYSIAAARLLGVEAFGQFSFLFSFTQILLIGCDLGLHNTAVRKIAFDVAEDRKASARDTFRIFFSLKIVLSALLVCCAAVTASILPKINGSRPALLLFAIGMFFQSLNTGLNIGFQAQRKLYLGSINNVLMAVLNFAIAMTFMLLGGRVVALGAAYMLAMFLAFLANCYVFEKKVHPLSVGSVHEWREFALQSLPVGAGTLFNTIAARIDMTILTFVVGSYQTGIYSAAYRIYGSLLNIPIAIFSAVLPAMASFGDRQEGVRRLFDRSVLFMVATALPLAIGFYIFSGVLVTLLYGHTYAASADVLKILAWSLIPAFLGMAFGHVVLSQEKLNRRLPAIAAVGMLANIMLNLLIVPRAGNRGAAVSTLLTETIMASLYAATASEYLFRKRNDSTETIVNRTRDAFGTPPSPGNGGV